MRVRNKVLIEKKKFYGDELRPKVANDPEFMEELRMIAHNFMGSDVEKDKKWGNDLINYLDSMEQKFKVKCKKVYQKTKEMSK